MRIASWNVESIRSHHDQVVEWIDTNEPDVVCMQETKAGPRKFPQHAFADRGYELAIYGGDDGRGGVALASRRPIADITLGLPGAVPPLDEPRLIAATIEGIRVVTVYAPNGRKVGTRPHEVKLAWFALLAAWLDMERHDFADQMLIGDLNIAPLDIDIWEPSRYRKRNLTSPPERAAFDNLLAHGELIDVVRDRFSDTQVFTWWNRRSDFYETDRGWRLDHVLATPSLAARTTDLIIDRAERGRPGSTDHAPILLTIS